jgi:hypothetical protein
MFYENLPGMQLLVWTQQDVLVPQLVNRHAGFTSDYCVNPAHLKS